MKYLIFTLIGLIAGILMSDISAAKKIHQIEQYYSIAKEAVEECNKPHPDHVECKVIALYSVTIPPSKYERF